MKNRRCLLACGIATVLCVFLENWTPLDLAVQQLFYQQGNWIITKTDHAALRWFWYGGAKGFVGFIGGTALILALLSLKMMFLKKWRHFFCVAALSTLFVPLTVASLKVVTGVYSPYDLSPFGGTHPYMGMLTHLWNCGVIGGGRSFPAGHCSGGFALMAFYYLPLKTWFRHAGLMFGMTVGWGMGLYQMLRGHHFLTHTLTTMFLAWDIILCINYICGCAKIYLSPGQPEQSPKA